MSLRKKLKKHKHLQKERKRNMSDINSGKLNGEDVENKKVLNDENEKNANLGNEDENLIISKFKTENEYQPHFPDIEVIKIEDDSEEEMTLKEDENIDLANQNDLHQYGCQERLILNESLPLLGSRNRGIVPDNKIRCFQLSDARILKCCLIEHNYFHLEKPSFIPLSDQRNIRVITLRKSDLKATVPFQNRIDLNENRTEQQTLAQSDSTTKHVFYNSHLNSSNNFAPRKSRRTISVSTSSRRNSNSESENLISYERPLRYSLRSQVRRSSSNGNVNISREGKSSMTGTSENEDPVNRIEGNKLISNSEIEKSEDNNKIVSLDDIAKEISEMEKIIQSKCDVSCDIKKDKKGDNSELKSDGHPPKLRKIRSKDELQKSQKDGEHVHAMPNLTKMMPEDKNWNLEYTEDDVKNLGLDDLLLRASELNAENFTKALGQNATGRNGSKTEASEIVLSFPNARRPGGEDVSGKEIDSSKSGGNQKRAKLDFYKTYVKEDKTVKALEELAKTSLTVSPKRLGIKVKTVQNINEEFKDSLGAKLRNLEPSGIVKPFYTIGEDVLKDGQNTELFLSESRDKSVTTKATVLNRKMAKSSEQNKISEEDGEESRPFIMTIIQNKESNGTDLLPSPKVLGTPKSVSEDAFDPKKDSGSDKVTVAVSEPRNSRPFEVVNVEDYIPDPNCYQPKKNSALNYVVHYRNGSFARKRDIDGKILQHASLETGSPGKKKNVPFILNNTKKYVRMTNGEKTPLTSVEDANRRVICPTRPTNRLMKHTLEGGSQGEKIAEKNSFTVTSIEQKMVSKEGGVRLLKVANSDQAKKSEESKSEEQLSETGDNQLTPKNQLMSLAAFSNILKDILPDKWILSLDKRYGLQILKTHLDELLNPSIMISVVVGRTGKVTVNVRGRQLEKSHDLFSDLCDVGNSDEKISINYILSIINKLRFFNVCFGCDDLSLKKYWCEDGFIEYYTEFQQTYRSHICESLVRLGKRRCYPCHRMNESLKKRRRREQLGKKEAEAKSVEQGSKIVEEAGTQSKSVRRNFEEFIEESFINMKQKITDEIEKTREDEESEKVPKTQDEVLSFMGLTRKDSLDVNLRKSKRERKGFKKCESMIGNSVNKEELYFLEKYWTEINVLFSTSLLIGAYSRTSIPRLREKCRTFHKLLSTWRGIIRDNADWFGGCMNLAENLVDDDDESPLNADSAKDKFDKMDIPALRAYIINCVKEVNKIKSRLKTKNGYFKVLYNTFVRPRMKKARQATELVDPMPEKDTRKGVEEEDLPDKVDEGIKPGNSANTTSTEMDSSDEKEEDSRLSNGLPSGVSDGD